MDTTRIVYDGTSSNSVLEHSQKKCHFIFVFVMCSLLTELGLMPSSRIVFQCIVNVDFISDDYLKEGTVL